jgi:peptidyl-dipeptidase A
VIDDLVTRSNEIQAEFYNFRAQIGGREVTNNEILDILRSERGDKGRRAAWEASKQSTGRVAGPLLELVK